MKRSFLEYVAADIIEKYGTNLSRTAVVFPNKRASIFINDALARCADRPLWSPAYMTIQDLFQQQSSFQLADPIKLVCTLYKSFVAKTGTHETLDQFYGWGELLLADFDDIDKSVVDAEQLFKNLANYHELDNASYLTERQRQELKKFFSNFTDDQDSKIKQKFITLWNHLYEIYVDFNRRLDAERQTYEGALYRKVIEDQDTTFGYDRYIFVGFNMLQQVEQQLFRRLKAQGKAYFYWDFDQYYKAKDAQEAGQNINANLLRFPNELDIYDEDIYNNFDKPKDIAYISAATEDIQARYVAQWLQEKARIKAGRRTAVVLCDESLLPTVIHCLPEDVHNVNITLGYPLSMSPVSSLVNKLIELQTIGHKKHTSAYRLRFVTSTLRHPYACYVSEKSQDLLQYLKDNKQYYPLRETLAMDEGLELLFADIETDGLTAPIRLAEWLLSVLQRIGVNAKDSADPLFQESLFRMYTLINRLNGLLASGELDVSLSTFTRLMKQLVRAATIPFHGEPATGIQIMGMLETRNLDFDHILLLSCNEGNMPKAVNDSSFIPYNIRQAFGLTTIDHKTAIYAYYFYRLLQRSADITLLYNNATTDGHAKEMSRFMLQMLAEIGSDKGHTLPVKRLSLQAGQVVNAHAIPPILKDERVCQRLQDTHRLSPTAIARYLKCQLSFYYYTIEGIKESDNDEDETIDNRIFGNIFHKSAELLYNWLKRKQAEITAASLKAMLANQALLESFVDEAFREELFKINDKHRRTEYNGVRHLNREVIISYLKRLLNIDILLTPFTIKELECAIAIHKEIATVSGKKDIELYGIVDRLDEITDATGRRIRVIDYKTGAFPASKIYHLDEVFAEETEPKKHAGYYFQTLLYALIIAGDGDKNPERLAVSPALLFVQRASGNDYDPTLAFGKDKIMDATAYQDTFWEHLQTLLNEIFDPQKPFAPTKDLSRCEACPYKQLCKIQAEKTH